MDFLALENLFAAKERIDLECFDLILAAQSSQVGRPYGWSVDDGISKRTGGARLVSEAAKLGFGKAIPFDLPTAISSVTTAAFIKQAIKAARDKSAVLLDAVFDERPPVINVQEQTTTRYPESLYH
ncbi:MAG: hypothetical protein HGA23_07930, partial [Bacteroidales bacterium]|nr:hypothetical protein [Bacteroidales bacterium]